MKGDEARPLAQVNGLSGFLSLEQKQELIREITDAMRPVPWALIEEVPSDRWGIGWTPVTTDVLSKMAAQA